MRWVYGPRCPEPQCQDSLSPSTPTLATRPPRNSAAWGGALPSNRRTSEHVAQRLVALRADYTCAATDAVLMSASYLLVYFITVGSPTLSLGPLFRVAIVAPLVHLSCNVAFGLYGRVWQHAGIDEARRLILAGTAAIGVLIVTAWALGRLSVPIVVLGPTVATLLTGTSRFRARLFAWHRGRREFVGAPVVVVGAGHTGATVVKDLLDNPQGGYAPIAIVDDDVRLRNKTIVGIPIVGPLDVLPAFAATTPISQMVLAVPSATPQLVQRTADLAEKVGVPLRIVPSVRELIGGISPLRQVRKPRIEDLLGRTQVATDLTSVGRLIEGRSVLLTGAGGSIGSEIARQVSRLGPASLVLLDHDETHLHDVSASIQGEMGALPVQVLADIRDRRLMARIFSAHRPHLAFHAAAHKHVPMLEQFPLEAIRTNVFGTLNVLDAAAASGAEHFVFISSDKAVRPKSVLGATKRFGELLIASHARPPGGSYCSVRFGNVLGSRGSVVPTFERQIATGGPVTITDPDMTRFFMSIQESVQLVLQAAVFTEDNDLFMLEMGHPVRIVDLARRMIRLAGYSEHEIGLAFVGPRAGEKLAEELRDLSEEALPTAHPSIARLDARTPDSTRLQHGLQQLSSLVEDGQEGAAKDLLFGLIAGDDVIPAAKYVFDGIPARSERPRPTGPHAFLTGGETLSDSARVKL
jgi:FlaA1/EpsC-like NDP-sugar epimerase